MNANWPVYDGMDCPSCARPLLIEDAGKTAVIHCEMCGPVQSVKVANCRGRTCGAHVFFGGKSGKSPVNVATGASHFIDCPNRDEFRRKAGR